MQKGTLLQTKKCYKVHKQLGYTLAGGLEDNTREKTNIGKFEQKRHRLVYSKREANERRLATARGRQV